jgi:predicted DCC family thiol-disulfide oxidoreductase YuxK
MTSDDAVTSWDTQRDGVWFVYDGDCQICTMAAEALKIRQRYGPLHLLDARSDFNHPLMGEIRRRRFDLDEGMMIWAAGRFYHRENALRFMTECGESRGWFNRFNRLLFRSERLARTSYPWLRACRNLLLKLRGVDKLYNLRSADEPLFQSVFGPDWDKLPTVMKRHYANRVGHHDVVIVEGCLDVVSSSLGRALRPAFRLAKTLVPYEGKDVPCRVNFVTEPGKNAFRFERTFLFPGKPPFAFRSAMIPLGGNEVVEMMGLGLGWRSAYLWRDGKVILAHRGYVWRFAGLLIPLPLTLLLGAGSAEETALSDSSFAMSTEIRHPLWGRVFGYAGTFQIVKDS